MITGLDHIGIRVEDIDSQRAFYETLGFNVAGSFEAASIALHGVMMRKQGGVGVELLHFGDLSNEYVPIIEKHSAFASDNLEEDIERYIAAGYELVVPISEGDVVKRYAYVKDSAGNYIELCEPN